MFFIKESIPRKEHRQSPRLQTITSASRADLEEMKRETISRENLWWSFAPRLTLPEHQQRQQAHGGIFFKKASGSRSFRSGRRRSESHRVLRQSERKGFLREGPRISTSNIESWKKFTKQIPVKWVYRGIGKTALESKARGGYQEKGERFKRRTPGVHG